MLDNRERTEIATSWGMVHDYAAALLVRGLVPRAAAWVKDLAAAQAARFALKLSEPEPYSGPLTLPNVGDEIADAIEFLNWPCGRFRAQGAGLAATHLEMLAWVLERHHDDARRLEPLLGELSDEALLAVEDRMQDAREVHRFMAYLADRATAELLRRRAEARGEALRPRVEILPRLEEEEREVVERGLRRIAAGLHKRPGTLARELEDFFRELADLYREPGSVH